MTPSPDTENRATICRITCGWKKPELPLADVFAYWRDVHSPGISRRPGIWEYRHFQYAPVDPAVFDAVEGIALGCPAGEQLMWQSDVRYEDDAALARFSADPAPAVLKQLLADIDLIVDQSTTYKVLGVAGRTVVDRSTALVPQGPAPLPTWSLFFRQRGGQAAFRAALTTLAERWAATAGVVRLRLSLFEVPDMEAERKAGYPVKTHPVERQYQALIDISAESAAVLRPLLASTAGLATTVAAVHAYPVDVVYTSVYAGRPTFVGLRGYPAWKAMQALGGVNHADLGLLTWMYGADRVQQGPAA